MLHLRLRVPADLADTVVRDLTEDQTVTNVAVVPEGYARPAGTLVLADVARENATRVVGRLRDLGLGDDGSMTLQPIETILSADADRAEAVAPGAPDDGVVWVQVEQRLRNDSRLSWVFVSFLTLASLIAGAGRITDQPILIVGAMVVGPEFSPIAAICFALGMPRLAMLRPALTTLVTGFGVAVVLSTVGWWVAYQLGAFTRTQAGTGTMTDFIVRPDAWSFVVAVLAGIAGMLSLTTAKSGPLVGVFISITTVPALGTVAVCVACGLWGEVGSALVQLGVNLAGILLAGIGTMVVQRLAWRRVAAG